MRRLILAIVGAMYLATGSASAGGGEKGDFEFGPYAGYGWLDDYGFLHPKNDYLFGVRAGYFFTSTWSAEVSLQRLSTHTAVDVVGLPNQDMTLDACRVNALYNFAPGSHVRPFLTAGLGCEKADANDLGESAGLGLNAGGGVRFFMGDHFALRFDGRYVTSNVGGSVNQWQNNLEANLGLSFLLGGGPPKDTDADGVRDSKDDCPDTPHVAIVDEHGCPKDSDGDGVWDGIDQCPNTPKGVTVDARGCPIDSDGDGVFDGIDQCPNTPKGATVDAKGCPSDADGDGVYDGLDRCPDTPKGAKVDAKGCPMDGDGDGVWDGIDQCPDTPRGDKVDARGCTVAPVRTPPPIIQKLIEKQPVILEGVEFDFDKATLRPASDATLDDVAASLRDWPEIRVEIGGYTDSKGRDAYNLALSNRRAASVKAYLVSKGVSASRLESVGHGEADPIADNTTDAGRQKNRRVELHKID